MSSGSVGNPGGNLGDFGGGPGKLGGLHQKYFGNSLPLLPLLWSHFIFKCIVLHILKAKF